MGAKQLNIFDVLRQRGENAETYTAITLDLKDSPKNLPPPDDAFIPPPFGEATSPPPRTSSTIRIPNPPPKAISWLRRNWPWVLLGCIVVGVLIYLYLKRRKKKKDEEEFLRQEAERLPKINYPEPSEASGPVVELKRETPVESYFDELERQAAFEKAVERLSKVEAPKKKSDPVTNPKQPDQPK
jgi:hypothetical protein